MIFFKFTIVFLLFVAYATANNFSFNTKFPLHEYENLNFTVTGKMIQNYEVVKVSLFQKDRLVISENVFVGVINEVYKPHKNKWFVIDYVKTTKIDEQYSAQFSLQFKKISDGMIFTVHYINTDNYEVFTELLTIFPKASKKLAQIKVEFYVKYKMEFKQSYKGQTNITNGVLIDEMSLLSCTGFGKPFKPIEMLGIDNLNIIEYSKDKYNHTLYFKPSRQDTNKTVGCKIGEKVIKQKLNVYRGPTSIEILPIDSIKAGNIIAPGTELLCRLVDSWGNMKGQWKLVYPSNYSSSIDIKQEKLNVLRNATLNTQIKVKCVSPATEHDYHVVERIISFEISDTDYARLEYVILAVSVVALVVLVIIAGVLLVSMLYIITRRLRNNKKVAHISLAIRDDQINIDSSPAPFQIEKRDSQDQENCEGSPVPYQMTTFKKTVSPDQNNQESVL